MSLKRFSQCAANGRGSWNDCDLGPDGWAGLRGGGGGGGGGWLGGGAWWGRGLTKFVQSGLVVQWSVQTGVWPARVEQNFCKNSAKFLQFFCKISAKFLQKNTDFCKIFAKISVVAKILRKFCKNFAKKLRKFCGNFAEILHKFCSTRGWPGPGAPGAPGGLGPGTLAWTLRPWAVGPFLFGGGSGSQVCIKFLLMHTSGLGLGSKPQADPKPAPRETSIMNISRVWGQIKASIIPSSPFRSAAGAVEFGKPKHNRSRNSANPSTTEAKTAQTTLHKTSRILRNPRNKHKIEEQNFAKNLPTRKLALFFFCKMVVQNLHKNRAKIIN